MTAYLVAEDGENGVALLLANEPPFIQGTQLDDDFMLGLTSPIVIHSINLFAAKVQFKLIEPAIVAGDTLNFTCTIETPELRNALRCRILFKAHKENATAPIDETFDVKTEDGTLLGYVARSKTISIPAGNYVVITRIYNDEIGFSKEFHDKIDVSASGMI